MVGEGFDAISRAILPKQFQDVLSTENLILYAGISALVLRFRAPIFSLATNSHRLIQLSC